MKSRRIPATFCFTLFAALGDVAGSLTFVKAPMCFALAPQQEQSRRPAGKEGAVKAADRTEAEKPNASSVDWKSLMPGARIALRQAFSKEEIERHRPIYVGEEADITGDGIPEALVYTGDGGAYVDFVALMRIEDGEPVVARFKNADGKMGPKMLGRGASVRHHADAGLLKDQQAIYSAQTATNDEGTGLNSCNVSVYSWHAETRTFDYNRPLTKQFTKTYCEREAKSLLGQSHP